MNSQLQSLLQQAIKAFQERDFDRADLILHEALQNDINSVPAIFELGITFAEENRFSESIIIFNCLESSNVGNPDIPYNLGFIYAMQGDFECALKSFEKANKLKPNDMDFLMNYASTLHELKRFDEALITYEKVLTLKADYEAALYNMGNTLHELNRNVEALALYDKVLLLKPSYSEAWTNKAVALERLMRYDEALAHYDKALSLKSNHAEAWSNKAAALDKLKRYDEAIAHYDKALSLKPDIKWASGDLLHTKMKICSWSGLEESLENIAKKVVKDETVVNPFSLLALTDDALLHKKSSEIYALSKYPKNLALGLIAKNSKTEKIRIGYFSADFRHHAVSILAAELFELHDKNKFDIVAFSFGVDDKSPMRLRLSQAFNQFIDVSDMSDIDIARLSRDLKIDIAVDLGGYTSNSRTGLFAYRAAPIQLSYLGYLGTMGVEYIDYIVADKTIIPDGSELYYSEKIVYLPSYQVNDRNRAISDKVFTKRELGLPDNGFVFCCFNNNYKILPNTFAGWMRILKAVDDSVLFLYAENKWVEVNLKKEAEVWGVNIARLVFAKNIPADKYLARYRMCDLFLDTTPYNAGTTASDALWAGVPILTLIGQSFASRMAASLLNAIGLPELIASSQEEYEALAIELAMNPQKLADIKLKLARNRLTTLLFDAPLFTKKLEAAYIDMHERCHADLEPDHITIA